MGLYSHVRARTQKRVTSDLLTALHRLEQKCVRLFFRDRQKSGNGRKQVGAHRLHHRDQRGLSRQPGKFFEIRLQHLREPRLCARIFRGAAAEGVFHYR